MDGGEKVLGEGDRMRAGRPLAADANPWQISRTWHESGQRSTALSGGDGVGAGQLLFAVAASATRPSRGVPGKDVESSLAGDSASSTVECGMCNGQAFAGSKCHGRHRNHIGRPVLIRPPPPDLPSGSAFPCPHPNSPLPITTPRSPTAHVRAPNREVEMASHLVPSSSFLAWLVLMRGSQSRALDRPARRMKRAGVHAAERVA